MTMNNIKSNKKFDEEEQSYLSISNVKFLSRDISKYLGEDVNLTYQSILVLDKVLSDKISEKCRSVDLKPYDFFKYVAKVNKINTSQSVVTNKYDNYSDIGTDILISLFSNELSTLIRELSIYSKVKEESTFSLLSILAGIYVDSSSLDDYENNKISYAYFLIIITLIITSMLSVDFLYNLSNSSNFYTKELLTPKDSNILSKNHSSNHDKFNVKFGLDKNQELMGCSIESDNKISEKSSLDLEGFLCSSKEKSKTIVLTNDYFIDSEASLTTESREKIQQIAKILSGSNFKSLDIVALDYYNPKSSLLALSRATMIREELEKNRLDLSKVSIRVSKINDDLNNNHAVNIIINK